jgi:hypothetical protein
MINLCDILVKTIIVLSIMTGLLLAFLAGVFYEWGRREKEINNASQD